jgi:hypothetical protein
MAQREEGCAFSPVGLPMGKFAAVCRKFRAERKFPPQLRLIREKETSITFWLSRSLDCGPWSADVF